MEDELLPIDLEIAESSIIKVMGVGGGGCNAVNYLYRTGVEGVSFLVCNTDRQALTKSPVPAKLQLGPGLGAGGRPERAQEFANESREHIQEALSDGTQMVFITAGMGGGTGTGASPVVAEIAQKMGILTVGIVTIPFQFEGQKIIRKALRGVAKLAEHTDAILVINNEKLKKLFPDFDLPNAFDKSDEVVSNAAKAIAEIITVPGYINTDFQDVYNTLKDGGVAIMNVGRSSDPEQRITKAIRDALNSPLVNTTDVHGASRILLTFYCSKENAIRMQELDQINKFIDEVGDEVEVKWGASYDDTLGDEVRVTVIATGYRVSDIPGIEDCEEKPKVEISPAEKPTIEEAIKKFYDDNNAPSDSEETAQNTQEADNQPQTEEPHTADDTTSLEIEEEHADDTTSLEVEEEHAVDTTSPEIEEEHAVEIVNDGNASEPIEIIFDLNDSDEQALEDIPSWRRRR